MEAPGRHFGNHRLRGMIKFDKLGESENHYSYITYAGYTSIHTKRMQTQNNIIFTLQI